MARSDSRERMITAAADLFARHGYHATSWRQVVDHGDAPWGSIAFLFPGGKTELATEAIGRASRQLETQIRSVFFDPNDPQRSLEALVNNTADLLVESEYELGGPIATMALEMSHRDDAIQAACESAYALWTEALDEMLTPTIEKPQREQVVSLFLSAYDGALVRAKATKSREPLDRVADAIPRLLA